MKQTKGSDKWVFDGYLVFLSLMYGACGVVALRAGFAMSSQEPYRWCWWLVSGLAFSIAGVLLACLRWKLAGVGAIALTAVLLVLLIPGYGRDGTNSAGDRVWMWLIGLFAFFEVVVVVGAVACPDEAKASEKAVKKLDANGSSDLG